MKRFLLGAIVGTLVLSGCSTFGTEATNARQMKQLLDEKQVDCLQFEVQNDEEMRGELLTCADGTVKAEEFAFLIWPSSAEMELAFSEVCMNLKRLGNADEEFIVEGTWIAYSASTFWPASALAQELGAEILSGESFCNQLGLEIAAALSEDGVDACRAINESYQKFRKVKIAKADLFRAGANNQIYFGSMVSPEKGTLNTMGSALRKQLRELSMIEDVPAELADRALDIDHLAVYRGATEHDNGTSPAYLFLSSPDELEGRSAQTREERQLLFDHWNEQVRTHNSRAATFEVALAGFNLQLAGLLDTCAKYAPIKW